MNIYFFVVNSFLTSLFGKNMVLTKFDLLYEITANSSGTTNEVDFQMSHSQLLLPLFEHQKRSCQCQFVKMTKYLFSCELNVLMYIHFKRNS